MNKRMIIMLACLVGLFSTIVGWRIFITKHIMKTRLASSSPVATSTIKVQAQNWQPYVTSMGTLVALQKVDIIPQVSGIVSKIYFKSGDIVTQGMPLIELDARLEQTNLASDSAGLKLAETNFQRLKNLYKTHVISRADYDKSSAELAKAKAAVAHDQVLIVQKHVVVPFSGKLGISQVSLGEYIAPGGSPVVNLQTLDPLDVEFSVPQQDVVAIKIGQPVLLTMDAYPGRGFKGFLVATNAGFDPNSHMLLVRARLANPTHELYPGMYANVNILLPVSKNVIVVPQTAVEYNLYGNTVYVVKHRGTQTFVKRTFVDLGQRRGDVIVIKQGLQSGDEIVTVGQNKLYDNALITIYHDQESGT